MNVSGYRGMWVMTMFDLPVDSTEAKKQYAAFRKALLHDGFLQMQFSVYIRHCASRENADVHVRRVEKALPPRGEVRILLITDKQFERTRVFLGRKRGDLEDAPSQLELF